MRIVSGFEWESPVAKIRIHHRLCRAVSFSAVKQEACLWGWDWGDLELIQRLGSGKPFGSKRFVRMGNRELRRGVTTFIGDVTFHPVQDVMALVAEGQSIMLHRVSDGGFLGTVDNIEGPCAVRYPTAAPVTVEVPSEFRGFSDVAFSRSGATLLATCLFEAGCDMEPKVKLYDTQTGRLIRCTRESDTHFTIDPRVGMIAAVRNDQAGPEVHFFQLYEVEMGEHEPPRTELNRTMCGETRSLGWRPPLNGMVAGMAFSPTGDRLALVGALLGVPDSPMHVVCVDFPSLEVCFDASFLEGAGVDPHLQRACYWSPVERVVFNATGRHLFIPLKDGSVVVFEAESGSEVVRYRAHHGVVSTLDYRVCDGMMVTGGFDSHVKLWETNGSR